jgi:hypothetical protein
MTNLFKLLAILHVGLLVIIAVKLADLDDALEALTTRVSVLSEVETLLSTDNSYLLTDSLKDHASPDELRTIIREELQDYLKISVASPAGPKAVPPTEFYRDENYLRTQEKLNQTVEYLKSAGQVSSIEIDKLFIESGKLNGADSTEIRNAISQAINAGEIKLKD